MRLFVSALLAILAATAGDGKQKTCAELLTGISGNAGLDAVKLGISNMHASRLDALRRELEQMRAGYVLYAPVDSANGITTIRFESLGGGAASEEARATKLSAQDLKTYLVSASQPDAKMIRERLRHELIPENDRDKGKIVLLKDLASFGLSPAALGYDDEAVVVASSISRAAANLKWLETNTPTDAKYVALFGYPSSEAEYKSVFSDARFGSLAEWQQHKKSAGAIAREFDVREIVATGQDATQAKQNVLHEFATADGILFVVAHAHGATIMLPSGEEVAITAADIAALKLHNSPFVVLRVCQPEDQGFADAFIKAGARSVWLNRGVVSADTANQQVAAFMRAVRGGKSIGAAVRSVRETNAHARTATHLIVETAPPYDGNRGTPRSASDGR